MAEFYGGRTESYPSLTARKHWGSYFAGIGTEALFVLGLTGVGLLLAALALWVIDVW